MVLPTLDAAAAEALAQAVAANAACRPAAFAASTDEVADSLSALFMLAAGAKARATNLLFALFHHLPIAFFEAFLADTIPRAEEPSKNANSFLAVQDRLVVTCAVVVLVAAMLTLTCLCSKGKSTESAPSSPVPAKNSPGMNPVSAR